MAEQTNKTKTISFAGRTLDQNELVKKARAYQTAWMDNQGLTGDMRKDFESEFNDILDGLTTGRYTITDSGALAGKGAGKASLYDKKTGARIDGTNGSANRRGTEYSAAAHVMGYLNGMAGRLSDYKGSDTTETKSKSSTWDKSKSMGQYISDQIFGEGNPFSKAQLVRWADNFDAVGADGKRATTGRTDFIKKQLEAYKSDLLSGKFGEIDEADRNAEIQKIDRLLQGGLDSWEVGKFAPWASHLLFTDKDYYESDAERQAATEAAEKERIEAALKNGENPYAEDSDEYKARARELKQNELNNAYAAWVNGTYSPTTTSRTFAQSGYRTSDNELASILSNLQKTDDNYFKNFYSSLAKDINGGLDELEASYNPSTNWLGNDPGGGGYFAHWNQTDENGLRAVAEDSVFAPIASVIEPTRVFGNGAISEPRYFTPSLYKQFAYTTILEQLRKAGDLEDYKVGDNEYALLDTMDKDGNVLVYRYSYNKPTIVKTNIRKYRDSGSDLLWQKIAEKYATLNNIDLSDGTSGRKFTLAFRKEGGVLSAQEGTRLKAASPDKAFEESLENMSPEQRDKAIKARQVEQANNREIRGWDDLTSIEKVRIAGIGADVASAVAAFAPGYGTAAGAVLGVGSTLGNLWADINDPSVTSGQVWTQLGTNLGMDLISLVPGTGSFATAGKVMKAAKTVAPALLGALSLSTVPGAYKAAQKLVNGENLTVGELKDLSYGISALTGGVRYGKALHTQKQILKGAPKTERNIRYLNKDGEFKTHKVTEAQESQILNAKSEDEALSILHSITGDADAKFEGDVTYGKKLGWLNRKPKFGDKINPTEDAAFVQKIASDNERSKESLLRFGKSTVAGDERTGFLGAVDRRMAQLDAATGGDVRLFATNRELALGGRGKNGYNARVGSVLENERAAAEALKAERAAKAKATRAANKEAKAKAAAETEEAQRVFAEGLQNKQYKVDAEVKSIYDDLAPVNRAKHEATKGGDAAAIQARIDANNAEIATNESAFGATSRQDFETRWAEMQAAKASNPTKPTSNEYTADVNARIAETTKQIKALQQAIDSRGVAGKNPTPKQSSEMASLQQTLKDLRAEHKVARAKQLAAEKTWNLAQEAERQGAVGAKLVEGYKQQDALQKALDDVVNATRKSSKAYNAVSKRLGKLKKAQTEPLTDVTKKDLRKAMQATLGDAEPITTERVKNFRTFLTDLVDKGVSEAKIREILADKTLLQQAKAAYKFRDGGTLTKTFNAQVQFAKNGYVIKAYVGTSVPEPEKPKPTTPATTPTGTICNPTGTIGNPTGTIGSSVSQTDPVDGTINPFTFGTKKEPIGYGYNPTDLAISALESSKYGLTQGINGAIFNVMSGMRGVHEMPFMQHYRQWSAKPLEDQIAKNNASFNQLAKNMRSAYASPEAGIAASIVLEEKKANANTPLALQANEQIKTTVDQENAVGIANAKDRHDVGWRNKQGDVALSNARLKAFADYLHKLGTTASQNITARQYGMAKAGIANDNRAYQAAMSQDPTVSMAKNTYQELIRKKALNKDSWTEQDETALREATLNYKFAASQFTDFWNATHLGTTGTPYAGYGITYNPNGGDFFSLIYRRGGKMEAAEIEKTRRQYEKIYHDSMKLMVTESNKKLRNSAYAYYRKLFMHSK